MFVPRAVISAPLPPTGGEDTSIACCFDGTDAFEAGDADRLLPLVVNDALPLWGFIRPRLLGDKFAKPVKPAPDGADVLAPWRVALSCRDNDGR